MKKKTRRKIGITTAILLVLSVITWWGNNAIQVNEIMYKNDKLPKAFEGYKIVQVSDLHNKEFGTQQTKLLRKIENQNPNIIVITGDLIDAKHTNLQTAMELIEGMVKICPVYFVSGNHEEWSGVYEELKEKLKQAGVTVLEDEMVALSNENKTIELIGLRDVSFMEEEAGSNPETAIETTLRSLVGERDTFKLVLSHRPELFDAYVAGKADLVLSGHAHGGQFRIPFIGGLVAPDQGVFPKMTEGMHEREGTHLIISRGLGNSIIPLRILNRPELIAITLQSSNGIKN